MRTTDFSRIFSASPINRTAGLVTAGSQHQWQPQPKLPPGKMLLENPPETIPPHQYPQTPEFDDLRGHKFGRFTIVGYLGKPNPKKKARWLARCVCGHYEAFSAAAIKGNVIDDVCCANCKYQRDLPAKEDRR